MMSDRMELKKLLSLKEIAVIAALAFVLLVASYLRFTMLEETIVDRPLRADAGQYMLYAFNLKFNGTYSMDQSGWGRPGSKVAPDSIRTPGYPLFLAIFLSPNLPDSVFHALLAQTVLSVITVLMTFLLFRRLLSVWLALISSLLTALSPHLVAANIYLLTETLFAMFTVAWVLLIVEALKRRRTAAWLFCAGALLAYSALLRPSAQYLLPLLTIAVFFWLPSEKKSRGILAMILGFMLLFTPWIGRNLITLGNLGSNELFVGTLHHGIYPGLMYRDDQKTLGVPYQADPRSKEIGHDLTSVLKEIHRRFEEEPVRHLQWYLFGKPITLWQWNILEGMGDIFVYRVFKSPYLENRITFNTSYQMMHFLHKALVVLALIGVIFSWAPMRVMKLGEWERNIARLVSLVLLYFTSLHMIAAPFPRYSVPLRPLMYGMALFGAFGCWQLLPKVAVRNLLSYKREV